MQNFIIFVIVACAVVFLVYRFVKRRGGCGCGCDAGSGGSCGACLKRADSDLASQKKNGPLGSGVENIKEDNKS